MDFTKEQRILMGRIGVWVSLALLIIGLFLYTSRQPLPLFGFLLLVTGGFSLPIFWLIGFVAKRWMK